MIRNPTQWWALLAQGQRWQVEHRRWPHYDFESDKWVWFEQHAKERKHYHLPKEAIELLQKLFPELSFGYWLDFAALEQAERGLAKALSQLQVA